MYRIKSLLMLCAMLVVSMLATAASAGTWSSTYDGFDRFGPTQAPIIRPGYVYGDALTGTCTTGEVFKYYIIVPPQNPLSYRGYKYYTQTCI